MIPLTAIEEFTVEMQIHWWEAIKGNFSELAGGEDIQLNRYIITSLSKKL